MLKLYFYLKSLMTSKKGQGMVEYGLIIGLIAIVLITVLSAMTGALSGIFTKISTALTGV